MRQDSNCRDRAMTAPKARVGTSVLARRAGLLCALFVQFAVPVQARDGVLDDSFLFRGWQSLSEISSGQEHQSQSFVNARVDAAGRVIAVGNSQAPVSNNADCQVLITQPAGRDLQHFRRVGFDLGGTNLDGCLSLEVLNDGKLLVSGYATAADGRFTGVVARLNDDGTLDTDFFDNGIFAINSRIPWIDPAEATLLVNSIRDPEGRVLAVGRIANAGLSRGLVIRFNADGSLDTAFGLDGAVPLADFNPPRVNTSALALAPDGKIYVAGSTENPGLPRQTVIFRLLPDGSFDTSYGAGMNGVSGNGGGGRGFTGRCDRIGTIALDANGRLLLGCEPDVSGATPGPILAPGVLRLTTSGQPDPAFGSSGLVQLLSPTSTLGSIRLPPRIALSSDGRITVASTLGVAGQPNNPADWYVTRLLGDGTTDFSFGYQGGVSILGLNEPLPQGAPTDGAEETINNLALDPRGRPIVVGARVVGGQSRFLIGRLGMADPTVAHGFLDPDFNAGIGFRAERFTEVAGNRSDLAGFAVATHASGTLTTVGRLRLDTSPSSSVCTVARHLASGARDTSFNGTGRRTLAFSPSGENGGLCRAVLTLDDGGTLIAGFAATGAVGTPNTGTVLRLLPNGQVDSNYFGNGVLETWTDLNFQSQNRAAILQSITRDPSGRILVAGYTIEPIAGGSEFYGLVLRLNPDLSVDTSFGEQGVVRLFSSTNPRQVTIQSVVVAPSGLIYAVGSEGNFSIPNSGNTGAAVYRLLDDGSGDPTYPGGGYLRLRSKCNFGSDRGAALDASGRLLLPCFHSPDGLGANAVAGMLRLLPNGQPDINFGNAGVVTARYIASNDTSGMADSVKQLLPMADGRLIVVGNQRNTAASVINRFGDFNIAVQRLLDNGSPDLSFASNAAGANLFRLPAQFGLVQASTNGALLQDDGRIVVVGTRADFRAGVAQNDRFDILLLRVGNEPPPAPPVDEIFVDGFE